METKTLKLYSPGYRDAATYLAAGLFVVGNIVLPQLFHLLPQGGLVWLPIYFFTLIGAYKYGWKVGLLTAFLSPLLNHILGGMPPLTLLPAIWIKSGLLAVAAGYAAARYGRISISILLGVVLSYQVVGTLAEWPLVESFHVAVQDFRMAIPGMLLQVFGGYFLIRYVLRK